MGSSVSRVLQGVAGRLRLALLVAALAGTFDSLGAAYAKETPPRWSDLPTAASLQFAPLTRVQRNLGFLFENTAAAPIRDALNELVAAVDGTRSAGIVIVVHNQSFVPIIFVPIKEAESLLGLLHERFGWRFHRGDDGLFRGDDLRVVARASGSWMYFTRPDHREHLAKLPNDPSETGTWSDPGNLAQLNVMMGEIPPANRAAFAKLVGQSIADLELPPVTATSISGLERVIADIDTWRMELQFFRPLNQFHVSSRITPVTGSDLERNLAGAARRPAVMDHLAAPDAVAAATVSGAIDGEPLTLLKNLWAGIDAAARPQLPSPRSKDVAERRVAALGTTVLDTVKNVVAKGSIDAGLALHKQGDEFVLLAGASLPGARAIEQAASNLFDSLTGVPAFQALQWATGANGDVTVHEFQLPADDSSRWMFGDTMHIAAGFGADRVYAAIGGESAMEELSLAIDRSREDTPGQGGLVHVTLRVAPLLALLAHAPSTDSAANASVQRLAEVIAAHRKSDVMEFDVTAVDRTLEARLRIDSGVVRTLMAAAGDAVPTDKPDRTPTTPSSTDASNLALRVKPNDRFELQFDTDSDVKTVLENGDRMERATYSSLYAFRVLEARPDGAVRLEAMLKRARITKKSPDGDWTFDSAATNKPGTMNPEMVLYLCMVDEPFQVTVAADGTLDDFDGLEDAIDRIVDNKLIPPAEERAQAKSFMQGSFNPGGLRDTLGRAFEFYPGKAASVGDRWTRTSENVSGIVFDMNNKFLLKSRTSTEAVISVRGQVVQKEADPAAPIRWEVMGTETGTVTLDPSSGRLLDARFTLSLDAEATLDRDGKSVVTPVVSTISMRIAPPDAEKKGGFPQRKRD